MHIVILILVATAFRRSHEIVLVSADLSFSLLLLMRLIGRTWCLLDGGRCTALRTSECGIISEKTAMLLLGNFLTYVQPGVFRAPSTRSEKS